jgi:hypothetical protein
MTMVLRELWDNLREFVATVGAVALFFARVLAQVPRALLRFRLVVERPPTLAELGPKGADASNIDCNFSTDLRYMDSDQPNLAGTFQCAARVGTGSTDDPERPMEAMVQSLSNQNPVATCNFGYGGPLTETVLLGNVAYRSGQKLQWDGARGRITNTKEADRFISRPYRKGWR